MQASTQLQLSQLNLTTEQLHTFLHLTTQAPLESVCRSSLYVLANVPAGRQGVLEYLSTFYKVATFLHLRYQINLKNSGSSSSVDLTTEANSLVQINQAIEIIETELGELLSKRANDLWSLEIIRWLADMLGDIVHNTATTCADSMQGLSSEEIAAFKSPTINDGLEIWSKQCKPVQSFLNLILKTYTTSTSVETKSQIIDILFETSSKYPKKYDWALAYFSCLDIKVFLSKLFDLEYKELFSTTTTKQKQTAPQRCNVVNFVAKSYPKFTYEQIVGFLDNKEEDDNRKVMFLLRLAAHSPNLFTVLLNQLLNSSSPVLSHALVKLLDHDESRSKDELFNCLNQLSNSIAVFEILSNLLDLVSLEIRPINGDYYKKICHYSIQYIDELISSIYKTKSLEGTGNQSASESMGFLKSLNQIDGYSYQSLVKSLMRTLKNLVASSSSEPTKWPNNELELAYKLTLLMMINTNEYKAGVIMREMLTIDESSASSSKSSHSLDENVLVKIRQEVGSFHSMCFGDSVKSLVNFFATVDVDEDKLSALVGNLVLAYDWDIQNKCSMNQNVSNILLDRECFVGLMKLLKPGENYSLKIMELYNRIFKHDDEDPNTVKLTINDLIQCSHLFVAYFFDLTKSVDETNVANKVKEINEMLTLLENTVFQQFNSLDENNPYRNILLRNLIEKLLESLVASEPPESSSQLDLFDENSNLFTSNIESISSELITNKSRLKAVRNSLISSDSIKRNRLQIKNQFKSFRNLALVEFIEVICKTDDGRRMSSEQLTNLADLLVQNILLEQHFVDYQWSSSSLSSAAPNLIDIEESFESELESIKLFVERDMSVQNKVENHVDNQIIWILLELIASDEQAFIKAGPIIRSLLSSVIIQWESLQETPTRNNPKTLGITIRLLNIINRAPNFLNKPLCYIVDIVPFINSYETFIALMIIWRNLKRKMTLKPVVMIEPNRTSSDIKHLRYIFQKNMSKLACLYAKFFKI